MDDDGAVEEQRASARLGVGALHKHDYVTGLHLLRFQTGDTAHVGGVCASGARPSETCSIYITPQFDCQSLCARNIELWQKTWPAEQESKGDRSTPCSFSLLPQPFNTSRIAAICAGVEPQHAPM
jgi:hypothetical protein